VSRDGDWDETFRWKDRPKLRFANPFFRLKIGRYKATAPGVWHLYCRSKIRFSDPADFATTRIPIGILGWHSSLNWHGSFKDSDPDPTWSGFRFLTLIWAHFCSIPRLKLSFFLHCTNRTPFYCELPSSRHGSFRKMRKPRFVAVHVKNVTANIGSSDTGNPNMSNSQTSHCARWQSESEC
jgi:hypothetical protein